MYCGYITKITNVRKHSNADRLLIGECFGNSVVISTDTDINSLGVYFPIDGTLSKEFAEVNNLCRKKDENGNNIGGFLDPNKRNITALKLRGEKSDGLWLPIKCLEAFCDISKLKEGEKITTINGKLICEKYIPRSQTRVFKETPKSTKTKKNKTTVKYPLFMEHADTEQLAYNLERFRPGDTCYITLKCHGTSQRTSLTRKVEDKPKSWFKKLFCKHEVINWDYITGSRRVVLPVIDGNNQFREKWHEFFKNRLNKGEEVYYEVVGYDHNSKPIMRDGNNEKVKDKEFVKQYGKTTRFSYGCEPGESDCYVYRMTMTNEDGDIVEYPWEYVKYRCEQMGVKTVPEFDKFLYTNQEDLKRMVDYYKEGSDPIGKTHTREGVVVRIDNRPSFTAFKEKNFEFKVLEGIIKDEATEPDMEEAQG